MSEIRRASISPIKADQLRNLAAPAVARVPVPVADGAHAPKLISKEPLVVAPETIAHAQQVAAKVLERLDYFPNTGEAADLISLALTVLHFKKES